ncbi:unnamed protein product, partial [Didymodactylos carnosus]
DVALKFISKLGKSEKDLNSLRREIEILRNMKHENIVEMIHSFETSNELVVVTERGLADLYQLLEDDVDLPEETVQKIACQLVSALYYLHSHRVLHRDMKPQNILIFQGGRVKLCDFGFARNMTMNTMVLTSIKGTPLYMCPELVDEKPYDHSADLWALGCILYEVYHGKPPFFTNNVFHLIKMIGSESVKWPKPISPNMKSFLEGLLTKDTAHRLTWPDLLNHSFVQAGVKVPALSESIVGPLTIPPTEEQKMLKQQQIKSKGGSRGPSKLLSKFMPDEHRKEAPKSPIKKEKTPKKKIPTKVDEHSTIPNGVVDLVSIEQPISASVQPVSTTIKKKEMAIERKSSIIDQPKLKPPSTTSDSEQEEKWLSARENISPPIMPNEHELEQYSEKIEFMNSDQIVELLHNNHFYTLLESTNSLALPKMFECSLRGASLYRNMMRIIRCILQSDAEPVLLITFSNSIQLPDFLVKHLKQIMEQTVIRKEPWFGHVLFDILIVIRLWFELITTATLQQLNPDECEHYLTIAHSFLEQSSKILQLVQDLDYSLCCETLMILIILCESFEDSSAELCQAWYDPVRLDQCQLWSTITHMTTNYKHDINKQPGSLDGDQASQELLYSETRMYVIAIMAAFTYPSQCLPDDLLQPKIKVANSLAMKLLETNYAVFRDVWIAQFKTPKCGSNILKAIYGFCLSTPRFSSFLLDGSFVSHELLDLLRGQISFEPAELDEAIELAIQISTVLLKQIVLQCDNLTHVDLRCKYSIKDERNFAKILPITSHITQLALTTQLLPQRAACALHLVYAIVCGTKPELNPDEYIQSLSTIFLQSECDFIVRFPFHHGLLDGVISLLLYFVQIDPQKTVGNLIDCELFFILWQQVRAAFQSLSPSEEHDTTMERSSINNSIGTPDWILISKHGIHDLLELTLELFLQRMHKCLSMLIQPESIMFESLCLMLSKQLVDQFELNRSDGKSSLVVEIVTLVCNTLMFPFSIETSDVFLERTLELCQRFKLIHKLLTITVSHLPISRIEVPIGLIGQLSYYQEGARKVIIQMLINDVQLRNFYENVLYSTNESEFILCDVLFTFTNLIRTTDTIVPCLTDILSGPKNDFDVLKRALYGSNLTKSRCCFLIGHMTKYSRAFCNILKSHVDILDSIRQCCFEEDAHVRKMAFYSLGNFICTNEILYDFVEELTPYLIKALNDTISKIRSHAVSKSK